MAGGTGWSRSEHANRRRAQSGALREGFALARRSVSRGGYSKQSILCASRRCVHTEDARQSETVSVRKSSATEKLAAQCGVRMTQLAYFRRPRCSRLARPGPPFLGFTLLRQLRGSSGGTSSAKWMADGVKKTKVHARKRRRKLDARRGPPKSRRSHSVGRKLPAPLFAQRTSSRRVRACVRDFRRRETDYPTRT